MRIVGEILEVFWRNWFVVRRSPSIRERKQTDNSPLLELLGFAATKNHPTIRGFVN